MWSCYDGRFKLLDFGLTFHLEEEDLHQIQSPGYKAPEAGEWNKYKDEMKKKRKRKLQGTYNDLTKVAPAYDKGLYQKDSFFNFKSEFVYFGSFLMHSMRIFLLVCPLFVHLIINFLFDFRFAECWSSNDFYQFFPS